MCKVNYFMGVVEAGLHIQRKSSFESNFKKSRSFNHAN